MAAAVVAALPPVIGKYGRYHDHVRGNVPNPPIKSTATHRGLFFWRKPDIYAFKQWFIYIFPRLPDGEDYAEEYVLEYFLPIDVNEISDEGPILPLGCKLVASQYMYDNYYFYKADGHKTVDDMQGRWKVREITTNEDDFVEHCVQGGYRIEVGNIFNFKDSITIFTLLILLIF